ncbi:MAG TPA: redoxin domain-containing protein [Gaiellaceae bacterium]|nr:redoxin domain-containing protein [Gaiellaceae bacterium]
MRADLAPGNVFPDLRLPEHTGEELTLSGIAGAQPLVLCFVRGWWCPKEQVRLRTLVDMQEELQREYGRVAVVTVDPPSVNGAFRAGLGAGFPFLSDEARRVAAELDLLEETDGKHRPFLPFTFLLDSRRVVRGVWCGFWFRGNPTPEELRQGLRAITRDEQPTFEPQRVWREGAEPTAERVWIKEDDQGREIQRGRHEGPVPGVGEPLGGEGVDGRPWLVHRVEGDELHLRKEGEPDRSPLVRHHVTAPR